MLQAVSSAQPSTIFPLYYVFIVPQPIIIRFLTRKNTFWRLYSVKNEAKATLTKVSGPPIGYNFYWKSPKQNVNLNKQIYIHGNLLRLVK